MPRFSITKYREAILGLKDIDNAELEKTYHCDTLFRYRLL